MATSGTLIALKEHFIAVLKVKFRTIPPFSSWINVQNKYKDINNELMDDWFTLLHHICVTLDNLHFLVWREDKEIVDVEWEILIDDLTIKQILGIVQDWTSAL